MEPILQTKKLDLRYGAFQALYGIDTDIFPNEITALIGPSGCGKSTFLRRVGDAGRAAGLSVVWLHCAGDPASLDGVYFPEKCSGFFDGTAPHTVEPALFGASGEYLDLGTFCRTEALDTARIRALNADCAMFRLRAQTLLARRRAGIRHAGQGRETRPV